MYDCGKLGKDVRVCLGWIWVLPKGNLECRQSEGPHIRRDRVCTECILRLALDALGGHVTLASDVRFSERFFELSRNAEVTELDVALFVEENICRFDIYNVEGYMNERY